MKYGKSLNQRILAVIKKKEANVHQNEKILQKLSEKARHWKIQIMRFTLNSLEKMPGGVHSKLNPKKWAGRGGGQRRYFSFNSKLLILKQHTT